MGNEQVLVRVATVVLGSLSAPAAGVQRWPGEPIQPGIARQTPVMSLSHRSKMENAEPTP